MTKQKDAPAFYVVLPGGSAANLRLWRATKRGAGIYEGDQQIAVVLPEEDPLRRARRARLMAAAPNLLRVCAMAEDYIMRAFVRGIRDRNVSLEEATKLANADPPEIVKVLRAAMAELEQEP